MSWKPAPEWRRAGMILKPIEWGLWKCINRAETYFMCYRPDGRYGRQVTRVVRLQPGLTVNDLKEHVRQAHVKLIARKAGIVASVSCKSALSDFLGDARRRNMSEKYVLSLERAVNGLLAHSRAATVDVLGVAHVETYLRALHAGEATPRTQNRIRAEVNAWLAWCVRNGYCERNPVERTTPTKTPKKLLTSPTPAQVLRIIRRAQTPYDSACLTFLVLSGLRTGSFLSLKADGFTQTGIRVPHTKRGVEWAIRYDVGCPLWGPHLSQIGRRIWDERPPTQDMLDGRFAKAKKASGFKFRLYDLRHAFCSWCVASGCYMADVASWAHHASQATTEMWYSHMRPSGTTRAAAFRKQLEKFVAEVVKLSLAGDPIRVRHIPEQ